MNNKDSVKKVVYIAARVGTRVTNNYIINIAGLLLPLVYTKVRTLRFLSLAVQLLEFEVKPLKSCNPITFMFGTWLCIRYPAVKL